MIISHEHPLYRLRWKGKLLENGAFYYSKEICEFFIPNIVTNRNWMTINIEGVGANHAIVFIHNNKEPQLYNHLAKCEDLILVCGVPSTCDKVSKHGHAIYLPLSVDTEYVSQFKTEKTKDVAYVGRAGKRKGIELPRGIDFIENVRREQLLREMARYRHVYAVGRTAIEARVLGCEILPFDERFPNPEVWKVFDSRDAVKLLQAKIDLAEKEILHG